MGGGSFHLGVASAGEGDPQAVFHVLDDVAMTGLSGQVAVLRLDNLLVAGVGDAGDQTLVLGGHLGDLGIGQPRKVSILQPVGESEHLLDDRDSARGCRVGVDGCSDGHDDHPKISWIECMFDGTRGSAVAHCDVSGHR
ncbi:hypothetical protein [Gordonia westfalica]|uniref:hypothetical protein n=1 Tax=Gordonia westfalica TaxID=158898 RepID=UPI00404A1A01